MCQMGDVVQEENENRKLNNLIILYVVLTIVTMVVIKKLSQGGLVNHILSGKAFNVLLWNPNDIGYLAVGELVSFYLAFRKGIGYYR